MWRGLLRLLTGIILLWEEPRNPVSQEIPDRSWTKGLKYSLSGSKTVPRPLHSESLIRIPSWVLTLSRILSMAQYPEIRRYPEIRNRKLQASKRLRVSDPLSLAWGSSWCGLLTALPLCPDLSAGSGTVLKERLLLCGSVQMKM